jgi:predicted TIM-barrel enzyme
MLCHGGPIAEPPDAEFILKHCRQCQLLWRLLDGARAVERALVEQTKRFKAIGR